MGHPLVVDFTRFTKSKNAMAFYITTGATGQHIWANFSGASCNHYRISRSKSPTATVLSLSSIEK
jgi:hypothetical protein